MRCPYATITLSGVSEEFAAAEGLNFAFTALIAVCFQFSMTQLAYGTLGNFRKGRPDGNNQLLKYYK